MWTTKNQLSVGQLVVDAYGNPLHCGHLGCGGGERENPCAAVMGDVIADHIEIVLYPVQIQMLDRIAELLRHCRDFKDAQGDKDALVHQEQARRRDKNYARLHPHLQGITSR